MTFHMKYCIKCHKKDEILIPCSSVVQETTEKLTVREVFDLFCTERLNEETIYNICSDCLSVVIACYNFRKQIIENKKFSKFVNDKIRISASNDEQLAAPENVETQTEANFITQNVNTFLSNEVVTFDHKVEQLTDDIKYSIILAESYQNILQPSSPIPEQQNIVKYPCNYCSEIHFDEEIFQKHIQKHQIRLEFAKTRKLRNNKIKLSANGEDNAPQATNKIPRRKRQSIKKDECICTKTGRRKSTIKTCNNCTAFFFSASEMDTHVCEKISKKKLKRGFKKRIILK